MNELIKYWQSHLFSEVIFTGKLKALDEGTVGKIKCVHGKTDDQAWAVIYYPQNSAFESDGKGGWKPIKGKGNKVYSHSVSLTEIKKA